MTPIRDALSAIVGSARVGHRVPLGPLTTFRVGGPAEWLVEARTPDEVALVVSCAHSLKLPVTLLGGGSNILVGERGIEGVVLRIRHGAITLVRPGVVRADGGVTLNGLVRWTIARGFAGLETWAGTPGTLGGGLHGNAHFQGALLSERVIRVGVVDLAGRQSVATVDEMGFGYDASRLQRTGEAVAWAELSVVEGEPETLRSRARASLAYRKRTQPLAAPSAGCIFRNPDPVDDDLPDGVPPSAGALIEHAGLKGERIGGAMVSPVHGNFIVGDHHATPSDIRQLIELCRDEVFRRFTVVLRDEVVYLGQFAHAAEAASRVSSPASVDGT